MVDDVKIQIPFGSNALSFSIQKRNLAEILSPNNFNSIENLENTLENALANPIGCPPLSDMIHPKDKILIISDDYTRLTPVNKLLPVLFEEFDKISIDDSQVQILMALGTHRAMSIKEMKLKVGEKIFNRVKVINHNYKDESALVDLGRTANGTPISVNRLAFEADFIIGIGSIVPHHIPGYSGGSKIIQPGICGGPTTAATHLLSTRAPETLLGKLNNQVRKELDEIADKVGLKFIINTILTPKGGVSALVAGDPPKAFVKGAEISKNIYGVPYSQNPEIVITNSYPCDLDFWQAHKSLYPAERIVSKGGVIIIITPCPEGISRQHPSLVKFAGFPADEIEEKYYSREIKSGVAAALAIAWAKIREKATIIMVSPGIPMAQQKALGFKSADSLEQAINMALELKGQESKISILTHAPDTLPLIGKSGGQI
jgi:nickel-dependent lactate racemase